MDLKPIKSHLSRKVTILVIPQGPVRTFRLQFSLAFILFGAVLWSGLTLWAGFISGRHVDYWVTKADNQVMRTKMTYLAQEMRRSRETLDLAKSTDEQLRRLLGLARRQEIVEVEGAIGGPSLQDRVSLRQLLTGDPASVSQSDWRRQLAALREDSAKRLASFQEIAWYIGNQRSLYQATPSVWPTEGHVSSLYGYRFDPMQRGEGGHDDFHHGVDIANAADTLISATAAGTVRLAGWSRGYGQMIVIDHGYGVSTLYAHNSKTLVKAGDRVSRGQVIAYMGTTGRSTGAHLHYEVWRHGKPVNPMLFLRVKPGETLAKQGETVAAGR